MNLRLRYILALAPFTLAVACGDSTSNNTTGDSGTTPTDASRPDVPSAMDVPAADVPPADVPEDVPQFLPDGAPAPNIVPRLRSPQIQNNFRPDMCEIDERCATAMTDRVLRFDLVTPNAGPGDLYLGAPTRAGRPVEGFEFSNCHRHYHLLGYAEYDLLDMNGRVVASGHKQSFCLEDTARDSSLASMGVGRDLMTSERWGCSNQGIHAGYYDLYYRALACQFIDITDVPAGNYRIRARVNTRRVLPENNYSDNTAYLDVMIPARDTPAPMVVDPQSACGAGETSVNRDCGWIAEDSPRYCNVGEMVTVGCNAACSPAVGRCDGDTMVRVCPANSICLHDTAIASNDNSCGNNCSSVTFMCPSVGQFRVMTAANGGAGQCILDMRRGM